MSSSDTEDYYDEILDETQASCSNKVLNRILGRRNIQRIKSSQELDEQTRAANRIEEERKKRLQKRHSERENFIQENGADDDVILDYDAESKVVNLSVHRGLVAHMKSHQKEGVQFMFDSCYESLNKAATSGGSGCILAHCMGLGKTFQVVALTHTLLTHSATKTKTVLICCPKSTLINWMNEYRMWIKPDMKQVKLYNVTDTEKYGSRLEILQHWQNAGGVCFLNYELFRILVADNKKKSSNSMPQALKTQFSECLLNPGPDLIICDEGHVLRNDNSILSKAINKVRTMRRVILTGTPMQNNLREYHCMVNFVKPNLLGSKREFANMFVNPILNGQYENSKVTDVQLMKERSYVLYKTLSGCVQRFDLETLSRFLPEKKEFVLCLRLTTCQQSLGLYYYTNLSARTNPDYTKRNIALFADYHAFNRIFSHPYALRLYQIKYEGTQQRAKKKKIVDELVEDGEDIDEEYDMLRQAPPGWWFQLVSEEEVHDIRSSAKFLILFEIIKRCEEQGEKLLVFSNSLFTLESIEYFLSKISESDYADPTLCNMTSSWEFEQDYFKLTGDTTLDDRASYCKHFNENPRSRLFLISTRAGGLGINLTGANRAVIFDASWNPSYDIQSIFRIYRLGQTKPCFVYRFVASGSMEEKIYERQVTKQSISHRVVDEKQITRHYTLTELQELYQLDFDRMYMPPIDQPEDDLLCDLLIEKPAVIANFHEHDSLLEHRKNEELMDVEKDSVWTAYNHFNHLNSMTEEENALVDKMVSATLDKNALRTVLQLEYEELTMEEIEEKVEMLFPLLQELHKSPDIKEILENELIHSKNTPAPFYTFDDYPMDENVPSTSGAGSVAYLYEHGNAIAKNARSKRNALRGRGVLNSWGTRGGRRYGIPDVFTLDSSLD